MKHRDPRPCQLVKTLWIGQDDESICAMLFVLYVCPAPATVQVRLNGYQKNPDRIHKDHVGQGRSELGSVGQEQVVEVSHDVSALPTQILKTDDGKGN